MRIRTKRVHAEPARSDGRRILVDRLWPRGVSKQRAAVDFWARKAAVSDALRRWYGHEPSRWEEFQRRYRAELDANPEGVQELLGQLGRSTNTLLFGSKEERMNNATVLRAYLEEKVRS